MQFSARLGQHDVYIAWSRNGNISGKCVFFHEYNDTLPSSGTEPRVDSLADLVTCALLHYAALPLVGILASTVFSKDTAARYASCKHRKTNFTITIRRS